MYIRNYARRLDIHVNFRLRTEMQDTSVFRLRSSFPIEEGYRLTGNEAYIHIDIGLFLIDIKDH